MNDATIPVLTTIAVYIALFAGHEIGDNWMQTDHQAVTKDGASWSGRLACAEHVGLYLLAQIICLGLTCWALDLPLTEPGTAAALAVSGASHYAIDRRWILRWFAALIGKDVYLAEATVVRKAGEAHKETGPGTALFVLDQSAHKVFLFLAALAAGTLAA